MDAGPPDWVSSDLSDARFAPYLRATSGDVEAAMRLYGWNSEITSAFLHPLHYVEVVLRNHMHHELAAHTGSSIWWDAIRLDADTKDVLLGAARRPGVTPDDVVAGLHLGFWVTLLSRRYTDRLWVPALHRVFPSRGRADVYRELDFVRRFRNRVAHVEPIHARHLDADHATLRRLLRALSSEAADHMVAYDRVADVLSRRPRRTP